MERSATADTAAAARAVLAGPDAPERADGASPGAGVPGCEIYWVVGPGQNVGKTTIACALIRALNGAGLTTVGFKPFAAGLLRDLIDLMIEHYPASRSAAFGEDAWRLARASPATAEGCEDLVVPTQLFCYPDWHSVLLARTGSAALGNVAFFANAELARFSARPDIARLERLGLPFAAATARASLGLDDALTLSPGAQPAAFARLRGLGPRAMVCEGSGRYLPVWRGSPRPNHLLLLTGAAVLLFPRLDLDLAAGDDGALHPIESLRPVLADGARTSIAAVLPLAPAPRRAAVADEIVRHLLDEAGLLPR